MRLPDRPVPAPADLAACAVLTLVALFGSIGAEGAAGETWLDTLTAPAITLPLLWRTSAPLGCAAALAAGSVLSALPTLDQTRCAAAIPAILLAAYAVAARIPLRPALAGLALLLAALLTLAVTDPVADLSLLPPFAPLCAAVWGAGRLARSRDAVAARLAARTAELERRRAETAALRVELERARLGASLDGAARAQVEAIVADAARGADFPPSRHEAAALLFGRIEADGRATLDDMRELLGALRSDAVAGRSPVSSGGRRG